jgi:hypothetical protein
VHCQKKIKIIIIIKKKNHHFLETVKKSIEEVAKGQHVHLKQMYLVHCSSTIYYKLLFSFCAKLVVKIKGQKKNEQ